MSFFTIPDNTEFDVTHVERVKETDPVVDSHINTYFQRMLFNDWALFKKVEKAVSDIMTFIENLRTEIFAELAKKIDGSGTITDYETAIHMSETGTVPDTTIIARLYSNFLAGCRAIAGAIRGGRDGNGTGGGTTAENETRLSTLTADIKTLAQRNYDDGVNDTLKGDATVSDVIRGKKFTSLVAGVNKNGELTDYRGTARQTVAPAGGTGTEILSLSNGAHDSVVVDRTAPYQQGMADAAGQEATFTNSFSSNTAGAASNLIVKCSKAGWTILNKAVATIAAGVNSSAIATTSATGEQTLNIVPGVYNKIKVDQTNAYTAGSDNAKGIEATFTNSFSSNTAGAASNLIVKCSKAGWTILNKAVATIAAGVNSSAIATTSATGEQTLNIVPGVYNKIKVDQTNAYSKGVTDTKKGDAAAADVLASKYFTSASAGVNIKGSMTDYTGSNRQTVTPAAGTGNVTVNLSAGKHDSVVVNRTTVYNDAYAAGQNAVTLHKVAVGNPQCPINDTTDTWTGSFTVSGVALSAANFLLVVTQIAAAGFPAQTDWGWVSLDPTVTYNASTGDITVTGLCSHNSGHAQAKITGATLYCVYTKPSRSFTTSK